MAPRGRSTAAQRIESIWYGDSAARWLLWPVSLLFGLAAALRRRAYRSGMRRSVALDVPVVVVGNISAGGTGKTPFIIWLAGELERRGFAPGIVTRGYGGTADVWPQRVLPDSDPERVGDEPVMLAQRTGRPVAAGPDRVAAARHLLSTAQVDVLLSDDGLQHYRMRRDFEIAVVDGRRGLGNGLLLPAGPLREPASRLEAMDAVIVNGGAPDGSASSVPGISVSSVPGISASSVRGIAPASLANARAPIYRIALVPSRVYRLTDGRAASLSDFAGRTVHAVAGIGHPDRFFDLLRGAGIDVRRHPLPDHARIGAADLRHEPAAPVLVTEKDAVKCRGVAHDDVWCVGVDVEFEPHAAEAFMRPLLERLRTVRR